MHSDSDSDVGRSVDVFDCWSLEGGLLSLFLAFASDDSQLLCIKFRLSVSR